MNQYLYDHREGFDPPFPFMETVCGNIRECKQFAQLTAKKGDIIVTHGRIPHAVSDNLLHFARVIANPHIALKEPFNLDRPDGNYVSDIGATRIHSIPADVVRASLSKPSSTRSAAHRYHTSPRFGSV